MRMTMPDFLRLADAKKLIFLTGDAPAIIKAEDVQGKVPRFSGLAYTGASVNLPFWGVPVVIDLAGVRAPDKARPVLFEHDPERPVGHFDPPEYRNNGREIQVDGTISAVNQWADQVVSSSKNGFPWQMSIGVKPLAVVQVAAGADMDVNGRVFTGPIEVVSESELKEISFVSLGADDATSAKVAASAKNISTNNGGTAMSFEDFVKSLGLDPASISEELRKLLESQYETMSKQGDKGDEGDSSPANASGRNSGALQLSRADRAVHLNIVASDTKFSAVPSECRLSLLAQAKKEDWTPECLTARLAFEVERAQRPAVPLPPKRENAPDALALKAGVMLRFGVRRDSLEKSMKPEAVELGARNFGRLSLKGLIAACCLMDGASAPMSYDNDDTWIRAAFSSASFPKILMDSMNKQLVDSYAVQPMVSRQLARKLTTSDFKTNTGIMFTRGKVMEKVAADGQIKHTDVGREESFTYNVETYAEMVGLTRQMLINDDLGVFSDFLSKLLVDGIATEEMSFFNLFHRNPGNFIAAANGNQIADVLSVDGLSAAITAFRKKKNVVGAPIDLPPRYLLVPPELEAVALQLYQSTEIRPASGNTGRNQLVANIHRGKYEPIVSAMLSDPRFTGITGKSEEDMGKCWYLLPDPNLAAAWGRAYLDGQETMTVEEVETAPNVLGRTFRGYIDLGHCQIDSRCVVKSDGTGAP